MSERASVADRAWAELVANATGDEIEARYLAEMERRRKGDACQVCGVTRERRISGPPSPPGPWTCMAHRHLQRRREYA